MQNVRHQRRPARPVPVAGLLAAAGLLLPACARDPAADCTLLKTYDGVGVYQSPDRLVSFVANVDVNTDGSLKSYHPDDPGSYDSGRLNTISALNTICNGLNIMRADGSVLYGPKQCRKLLPEFERLRPLGWRDPQSGNYVKWIGIASEPAPGGRKPCIHTSGSFVSQTGLPLNPQAKTCDPDRWPDALRLSSIVLANDQAMQAAGIGLGDVALVRTPGGDITGAVFIDTNPRVIGEGSVRLAMTLGKKPAPANYRETLRLPLPSAEYFVMPGSRALLGTLTNDSEKDIQAVAAKLRKQYGIDGRKACVST